MIDFISVESSNIEKIGYDEQKKQLHIIFPKETHYIYYNVSVKTWEELLSSESKGKYLTRMIKGLHAFQNVTNEVETN